MPSLPAPFHVGIIVADLRTAQARLRDLLGVTWGPVVHLDEAEYRDGAGTDLLLPTTMCYSTGDPALELIQETPGTVWVRNDHSNLHHIGFWSEDMDADSSALLGAACPLQLCGRAGEIAPVTFAYHRDDSLGIRFEILDGAMREAMSSLFEADEVP
ncbi:MAG: VOC family protein [Acidimicrobiia bacterium]|nr:VOC family protein [Acidimicrobiia bacterium]